MQGVWVRSLVGEQVTKKSFVVLKAKAYSFLLVPAVLCGCGSDPDLDQRGQVVLTLVSEASQVPRAGDSGGARGTSVVTASPWLHSGCHVEKWAWGCWSFDLSGDTRYFLCRLSICKCSQLI